MQRRRRAKIGVVEKKLPARKFNPTPEFSLCLHLSNYVPCAGSSGIDAHWLCCFACCCHWSPTCKLELSRDGFATDNKLTESGGARRNDIYQPGGRVGLLQGPVSAGPLSFFDSVRQGVAQ